MPQPLRPTPTARRWPATLATALALAAVLGLLATSWFLRKYFGTVTPEQVLFHLQHGGLEMADPTVLRRAGRYALATVLLTLGFTLLMRALPRRVQAGLWALLVLGTGASVRATLHDPCLGQTGDALAEAYADPRLQRFERREGVDERPDLLLVYVESLDEAYARPRPGHEPLLPQLVAWRQQHQQLGELRTLHGASWTMGGLFASLCGLHLQPLGLMSHNSFEHAERFFGGGQCLTDVLAAQGWELTFYGGASLRFAGKGKFLAEHGVSRRFGREQWQALGLHVPEGGWGLLDSALAAQAWGDMTRAPAEAGARAPRVHIVLTVDSHSPWGAHDPGCADDAVTASAADDTDEQARATLRSALRCSDRVVAAPVQRFLALADGRPKLVWVMGDHVTPEPLLAAELAPTATPRAVFHGFARADARGQAWPLPVPRTRQFTHVDVMPTLAEALGLRWGPQAQRLGMGVSLWGGQTTLLEREGEARADSRLSCPSATFERLWRLSS